MILLTKFLCVFGSAFFRQMLNPTKVIPDLVFSADHGNTTLSRLFYFEINYTNRKKLQRMRSGKTQEILQFIKWSFYHDAFTHKQFYYFDIFLKIVSVFNLLTETELLKVRVELNRRLFEADCCGVGAAVPLLHLR